jgi:hypothetical protein
MKKGFRRVLARVVPARGRVGFSPPERRGPLGRGRWVLLLGIVPLMLAAVMALFPAAASAADTTKGFLVYNWTQYPLTLHSIETFGNSSFDGTPPIGSVLQPGSAADFEMVYNFLSASSATVDYEFPSGELVVVNPHIDAVYNGSTSCTSYPYCSIDGTAAKILERPGTVVDVPGGAQSDQQAAVLNQLCETNTGATCTFTATGSKYVPGDQTTISNLIENHTSDDAEYTMSCSNTIGWSDTIGGEIGASGKVAGLVEVELKVKYSHEITADNDFTSELKITIRPGEEGWITDAPPLVQDSGDFTITLGNTTWHLTGVNFDGPWTGKIDAQHPDVWSAWTQKIGGGPVSAAKFSVLSVKTKTASSAATRGLNATQGAGVHSCQQSHG